MSTVLSAFPNFQTPPTTPMQGAQVNQVGVNLIAQEAMS